VRETLFNWLGHDLSGWSVLDAFAGSGALGFEAASRGATRVVLIEQDAELISSLRQTANRLGATQVELVRADALGWMRRCTLPAFDLVLLDPPFGADLFEAALRDARSCLSETGWIYLEANQLWSEERLAAFDLTLHRSGRAGAVFFHLLGRL
jgi:16S rRNA (guanine(966)-N(2))-methyltransferase RsmD